MQAPEQTQDIAVSDRGSTSTSTSPVVQGKFIAGLTVAERDRVLSYVLERALEDQRLKDVAEEIGVHRSALNQALLRYRGEEWQEVQVARALTALEDAELDLEQAGDMVSVIRANHRVRGVQFKLERLCRRLFGADVQGAATATQVVVNIGLQRDTGASD